MTALNFQKAFARILTDARLRDALSGKRAETFSRFDLDESRLNELLRLDDRLVEEYSRMLSATRLSMVLNVLPVAKKLLPADFTAKNAADYEMKEPPATANGSPTVEEVRRFARYLENSPEIFAAAPEFFRDVARYEITCFLLKNETLTTVAGDFVRESEFSASTLKLGERVKIMRFEYDVTKIIAELKAGKAVDPDKKSFCLIFQPLRSKVRIKSVGAAVCALLELCDGFSTVEEIGRRFAGQTSRPGDADSARKILKQLFELEILVEKSSRFQVPGSRFD